MEPRAKGLGFNKSLKLTIDCEMDAICCPSFLCEKIKKSIAIAKFLKTLLIHC